MLVRREQTEVRNSKRHQNTAVQATMCKRHPCSKYIYLCMRSNHYIGQQQPAGADGTSDKHVRPMYYMYVLSAVHDFTWIPVGRHMACPRILKIMSLSSSLVVAGSSSSISFFSPRRRGSPSPWLKRRSCIKTNVSTVLLGHQIHYADQ